jgi:hypothetical protein
MAQCGIAVSIHRPRPHRYRHQVYRAGYNRGWVRPIISKYNQETCEHSGTGKRPSEDCQLARKDEPELYELSQITEHGV